LIVLLMRFYASRRADVITEHFEWRLIRIRFDAMRFTGGSQCGGMAAGRVPTQKSEGQMTGGKECAGL
jgi:hypothetical protein